jgi:hypothetical protein
MQQITLFENMFTASMNFHSIPHLLRQVWR